MLPRLDSDALKRHKLRPESFNVCMTSSLKDCNHGVQSLNFSIYKLHTHYLSFGIIWKLLNIVSFIVKDKVGHTG